jgi:hypothetical protein
MSSMNRVLLTCPSIFVDNILGHCIAFVCVHLQRYICNIFSNIFVLFKLNVIIVQSSNVHILICV